jgi:hypothetical protein
VGIFTFGRTILLHPLRLKQKVLSLSFRHVSEANKEEPAFRSQQSLIQIAIIPDCHEPTRKVRRLSEGVIEKIARGV